MTVTHDLVANPKPLALVIPEAFSLRRASWKYWCLRADPRSGSFPRTVQVDHQSHKTMSSATMQQATCHFCGAAPSKAVYGANV